MPFFLKNEKYFKLRIMLLNFRTFFLLKGKWPKLLGTKSTRTNVGIVKMKQVIFHSIFQFMHGLSFENFQKP